jgi:hypothetical protein
LKFIDTNNIKFLHNSKGVTAKYSNKKFVLGTPLINELGTDFTDEEFVKLSEIIINFESAVRGFPIHKLETKKLILSNEIVNDYSPFSKYVSDKVFKQYIQNGKWQLGNIHLYRSIENIKQRDEFEGFSFLNFNVNNHSISQVCNTGFNYLIFCGTKSSNSIIHQEKFGSKELHFPDVRAFAERVCELIGAKRYFVQNVEYNTLKAYSHRQLIQNPTIKLNDYLLTPEYFDLLADIAIYPSLFVKPEYFRNENEVRIIFEMKKDFNRPYKFKDKQLLDLITY